MSIDFDIKNAGTIEVGVGHDNDNEADYYVPSDKHVQEALSAMVQATERAMHDEAEQPVLYEPSQKYGPTEYLYLPIR